MTEMMPCKNFRSLMKHRSFTLGKNKLSKLLDHYYYTVYNITTASFMLVGHMILALVLKR